MSSRISLMSKISLNTVPRTLTRSLKYSRFRRLGAQNRSFLIRVRALARARSTRFHTQRRSGSSFPWQSLALELIPNGGRPNNYLIATAKSYNTTCTHEIVGL
jgi:hypothetical protein